MTKREWTKIDKFSKKIKAINFLGGECKECGEKNIFTLEFHHIDEEIKETTIWAIQDYRWSIIEKEIKKCILLCGNCHNKLHFGEDNNSRWKLNKKIFLEYKGLSGCEKCGYNECNAALDFHHTDIKEKDFMISETSMGYNSVQDLAIKLSEELDKCIILCKNCHKLEHTDIDFFEKNKETIIKKSEKLKEVQSKIDRNKVKELYNSGMKQVDISKYFNSTKGTISNIISELGINKKSR